jgi:hypothetical protein
VVARGADALAGCKADDQRGKRVLECPEKLEWGQERTRSKERVVKLEVKQKSRRVRQQSS